MNPVVNSFVRNAITTGDIPYVVMNGMEGLAQGDVHRMEWSSVTGWVMEGGAKLGTKRTLPRSTPGLMENIVDQIKKTKLQGLVVVGGFEAYMSVLQLAEAREKHPELRIPLVILPATISNNVPGTDISLGSDTALNEITEICDRIKQSAQVGTIIFRTSLYQDKLMSPFRAQNVACSSSRPWADTAVTWPLWPVWPSVATRPTSSRRSSTSRS